MREHNHLTKRTKPCPSCNECVYVLNGQWVFNRVQWNYCDRHFAEGNMVEYRQAVRDFYGTMFYIIECEMNPSSNLLRDGPRLTAYKLIKQQNNNLKLILGVFEGTKVDNPGIFDAIWEFPRKGDSV